MHRDQLLHVVRTELARNLAWVSPASRPGLPGGLGRYDARYICMSSQMASSRLMAKQAVLVACALLFTATAAVAAPLKFSELLCRETGC